VQGTRYYLMDKFRIHPDPTDYQIIRFNNALQCCACICNLAACFIEDLRYDSICNQSVATRRQI